MLNKDFDPIFSFMGMIHAKTGWDLCRQEKPVEAYKEDFSKHFPSEEKGGKCFVPAKIVNSARITENIAFMSAMVLDSDSGNSMGEIINSVKKNLCCDALVYSTYSHLSDTSTVPASIFDRKYKGWKGGLEQFLIHERLVNKQSAVLEGAEIIEKRQEKVRGNTVENYIVKHRPCPKYRIIMFLKEPFWIAGNKEKSKLWQKIYCEVVKESGLNLDTACKDVTRAYYTPSCPPKNLKNAEFAELHQLAAISYRMQASCAQ